MTEKQKLKFSTQLNLDSISENDELVELDRSTLLVPGTHNGVKFPEEEIQNMDFSDKFPLNLNHERDIGKEVGFWQDANIEDEKLRANPILNKQTAAFDIAMGYVKNRKAMDGTAEVSIEVFGVPDENEDGEEIFTELELDKASLVDRGAVSPDKGAGIGMAMSADENFSWIIEENEVGAGIKMKNGNIIPIEDFVEDDSDLSGFDWEKTADELGVPQEFGYVPELDVDEKNDEDNLELYVPDNPDGYGTSEADWEAPNLNDFTDESFDDLDESEKREIAAHFAYSMNNPPEKYADLKLPHHDPDSSDAVWNGVTAAMAALAGARGGVDMPDGDKSTVYSHLAGHYDDFDEQPPAEDDVLTEEEFPEEFETEMVEVPKEDYNDLQSEVIDLRDRVQELEEELGVVWADAVEEAKNDDDGGKTGRKTAVNGSSGNSTEKKKEFIRKLLNGEVE